MRNKRNRRLMSVLLTLSLLVTLLVPMVGPASAKSLNSVNKVLSTSDDATISAAAAPVLTIREDDDFLNHFVNGDTFRLVLPSTAEWNNPTVTGAAYTVRTDQVLEITFNAATAGPSADSVDIALGVILDGAEGEVAVKVEAMDAAVTEGSYTFLVVGEGDTTAVAESVETIGKTGTGGIIRIEETYIGSVADGSQTLRLKLPSNFTWNGMDAADISFAGGFSGAVITNVAGDSTSTLTVTFDPPDNRTQRGTIYVTPRIKADNDASYGDVEVSIDGTEISDADVIVAKYADYGVEITVDEVKDIIAGKFDDQKTGKVTIEENVRSTFLAGRDINIEFPDWVKVTRIFDTTGTDADVTFPTLDGKDSNFDITVNTTSNSTDKIEFKLELSVEGNMSGDIEAVVNGAGIEDYKVVVAKAVAPVSASCDTAQDVKIGVQGQEVPDIVITENIKGAIEEKAEVDSTGATGEVVVELPTGVKFAATPEVEVIEGNLELKDDGARLTDSDRSLTIAVDSESTKPSKIKVSGIKLTLDRTVPEGDLMVKVKGNAIVENYRSSEGWLNGTVDPNGDSTDIDAGEFDTATAVKFKLANCVTPADQVTKTKSVFKIGEMTYTVNDREMTMDVAPYIKNERTYMPLRFVANASGVADSNIMWNDADQSVVLIKGDRVVKLIIGDTTMLVNGVPFMMDVAPEIADPGRTMMPIRWVAQALGCTVTWDDTTQTVTVE
ncbi:MAG: hypothetical protein A4E53_00051 [Pelotomaculum sp. PtaB.Bin104]|nr:MAG: hypothetical protein A4E53_00051 [Pelotomaculum sp. PtaB.Bin104]